MAQGANPLHIAQHQWLGARETGWVDAKRLEQLRQFIGGMRPPTDQRIQFTRRNLQFARDAVKIGAIHLAYLAQLPPVLQPVGKRIDQKLNAGIWMILGGHGAPPIRTSTWMEERVVALDQISRRYAPIRWLATTFSVPNRSAAHAYRLPATGRWLPRPFGEMCSPIMSGSPISAEKSWGSKNSFGSACTA